MFGVRVISVGSNIFRSVDVLDADSFKNILDDVSDQVIVL